MAIDSVILNVADVSRAVAFYTRFLRATVIGRASDERATLDVVSATIELVRLADGAESTWEPDDLQTGFRHIGFKVAGLDGLAAELKAAGVPFHLDPLDAEGDVRITFFFDPDGTLLELVEGDLQYHEVTDESGVAAERAMGVPVRPRLDHVAVTAGDFGATSAHYAPFGFTHIGTLHQPSDPRGFQIRYLRGGDTVLEVFTFETGKRRRAPQLDAPGFVCAQIHGTAGASGTDAAVVGTTGLGTAVNADGDGFLYSVAG